VTTLAPTLEASAAEYRNRNVARLREAPMSAGVWIARDLECYLARHRIGC
jgi:hypothetical protein